jgi:uncharacterized membrane protein
MKIIDELTTKATTKFISKILTIITGLAVFDAIYFHFIYRKFRKMIHEIQGFPMVVRLESALICYLVLTGLLYYFIILPGRPATDAALLGVGTYAVYETTSYAVLKKWEPQIVIIDSLWGGALFYLVTSVVYFVNM